MQHHEIIQVLQDNDTFLITYYAKKHKKIITRKATWTKPDTDTQGKHFVSNKDIVNHLATLKNKTQTREQKILARKVYDQQQAK